MTIYDFTMYVNQDVDDTFTVEEIARWFNKAVANFNLIPPVTKYPYVNMDVEDTPYLDSPTDEFLAIDEDPSDGYISAYAQYPFKETFMLAIMLPYVVSAVKSAESSITEKQIALQEFNQNSRQYKATANISDYLENQQNADLKLYQLGENVYLTDFTTAPFAGEWGKATSYKEVTITRNSEDELVKYVDDSFIDEEV